ncbi:MAG: hypothetical protein HKN12_02670, partial [Gemmatimonadetes bacterium]|nr:hypothetical protein [Gemmatimonadota bacterium]
MTSSSPRPLHERLPFLGWLRKPFRAVTFGFLRKALETDEGREMARRAALGPERVDALGLNGVQG